MLIMKNTKNITGEKMKIKFLSLKEQYQEIRREIDRAVLRTLKSGWYILGQEGQRFEEKFKNYLVGNSPGYVVGLNSGTDAIRLSLLAAGVKPGEEVITVANTAIPTISAICSIGAKPVFVDIDRDTWLLDWRQIEKNITRKTRAMVVVHLYGNCAEMKEIMPIARKYNLLVVEDTAQACGSLYQGRKAGTLGDFGAFSFYPTKNLGADGDAGAIFIRQKKYYEKLKMLRNYGQSSRYYAKIPGGVNSRLDEIQAAILSLKLRYLDRWNKIKYKLALTYQEKIRQLNLPLQYQKISPEVIPAYHLFVARLLDRNRDELRNYLKQQGIETLIHYPVAANKQPAFASYHSKKLPVTEQLVKDIVSLPFHQYITEKDIEYLFRTLKNFFAGRF